MKTRSYSSILITTLLALAIPLSAAAAQKHHHYKLFDTGTLGGPTSSLGAEGERDLNNQGTLVSLADTALPDPSCPSFCFLDGYLAHTVEWRNGVLVDLGALSDVINNSGPIWISDSGLIAGLRLAG